MAVAPSPAPVFSSSYVAVEQFNPVRYYSETGATPKSLPTGTTGDPSTVAPSVPLSMYVPFAILIVIVWALESHKFGRFNRLLKTGKK